MGSLVWTDQTVDSVHIFNEKMQQISVHSRANQGFRSTDQTHINPRKRSLAELGVKAFRTLQGLIYLAREHPIAEIEHATCTAIEHGCFRFKDIRSLLKNQTTQLSFIQSHPIIRDMNTYQVAF